MCAIGVAESGLKSAFNLSRVLYISPTVSLILWWIHVSAGVCVVS